MSNDKVKDEDNSSTFPYQCDIVIALPSSQMADEIRAIVSVDREIGDRVVKSISANDNKLVVQFQATEARLLRVSVSSFYEYLTVCLKGYQEFGGFADEHE